VLLLVSVCVGVIAGNYAYQRYQGHKTQEPLDAAIKELDRTDPGWRLQDVERARAAVPADSNSALVVADALEALPKGWQQPPKALRQLADRPPQYQLDDQETALLRSELEKTAQALQKAREIADLPYGRYPLDYQHSNGHPPLPQVRKTPTIVSMLLLDALAQTQAGDMKLALGSCSALLNCARSFGDEPFLLSQLMRISCVGTCIRATEHALAQGEPEPEALLQLQDALQQEEAFPRLSVTFRGERAAAQELFEALERGDLNLRDIGELSISWSGCIAGYSDRDIVRAQHPKMLADWTEATRIAALPAHDRRLAMEALDAQLQKSSPLMPFWHAIAHLEVEERKTEGSLRCLIAALAAERFRHQHGSFPKNLGQLVPEFLSSVPLDPEDGQPLRYQHRPDRVVIYSASGRDRKPPVGGYDPEELSRPGVGVAVHLFEVQSRRQPAAERLPPPVKDGDVPIRMGLRHE
jgi:hypothetical protein